MKSKQNEAVSDDEKEIEDNSVQRSERFNIEQGELAKMNMSMDLSKQRITTLAQNKWRNVFGKLRTIDNANCHWKIHVSSFKWTI